MLPVFGAVHARTDHLIDQTFNLSTAVYNFNYATKKRVKTAVSFFTSIRIAFGPNFCKETDFREQVFSSHVLFPPGECRIDGTFEISFLQVFI